MSNSKRRTLYQMSLNISIYWLNLTLSHGWSLIVFPGQLIRQFNWGPSQPSGDDQHCMYIVGGFMGYQWADFHCSFEMTFLCEYEVNPQMAWRKRRMNDDKSFDKPHQPRTNDSQTSDYLTELSEHIKEFQKQAQEEQEFSTFPSDPETNDPVTTVKAMETTSLEVDKMPVYITPLSKLANVLVTSRTPLDGIRTKATAPEPVMVSSGPIIHHQNSVVITPSSSFSSTSTTKRPKLPPLSNNVFSFKDKTRYPAVQQNGPLNLQDKQKAWKIYDLIKQKILLGWAIVVTSSDSWCGRNALTRNSVWLQNDKNKKEHYRNSTIWERLMPILPGRGVASDTSEWFLWHIWDWKIWTPFERAIHAPKCPWYSHPLLFKWNINIFFSLVLWCH